MNVILYVIDALRADHVSCYGYERDTTPNIDALAADGVRLARCFTPATWTRPVAASICTGSYPPAHGTQTRHDTFDPHVPPLAERFSTAGYETVGITSMGNVSSSVGFDRGFDEFHDLYLDQDIASKRRTSTVTDEELKQEAETKVALPRAADLNDAFEDWLDGRDDDRSFFTFMWSIEPHIPYDPPEKYQHLVDPTYKGPVDGERESLKTVDSREDLEQLMSLYDGEIAYNDACLGALVDTLRSEGLFEETLFVVVGDHGDAFREHGRLTHGHAPHDELMHVPCVIRPPERTESELTLSVLSSLVDLYPTVIDYATDLSVPDGVQGLSFADAFDSEPIAGHDYVFSETMSYDMQNTFYGVRSSKWKYIEVETPDASGRNLVNVLRYVLEKGILTDILRNPGYYFDRYRYSETEFLYDLTADPDESRNRVDDCPDVRERLVNALEEWRADCAAIRAAEPGDGKNGEIDEATQEQLRELGYTD